MRTFLISFLFFALALATTPFNPQPVTRSAAEIEFRAALDSASGPGQRMIIAENFAMRHPDDVPLVRLAADELKQGRNGQSFVITFFKKLSEDHPELLAPRYAYARVADDTLVWDAEARWALAQDSTNSWAWLMWMAAEWHKAQPDAESVRERVMRSIQLDASRPEGFMFLGQWYEEHKDTVGAIEAYKAGLVCDPEHRICQQSLEALLR